IEKLEGKRRLWDHQIALGTLTVHLWIQPPPEATATAFTTLRSSWNALASTAHGAFLGGVALLPWSPLLALAVFAFIRWRRRPTALPQGAWAIPARRSQPSARARESCDSPASARHASRRAG